MIRNDDTFRKNLDDILKRQGLKKAERSRIISVAILQNIDRNEALENAEQIALEIEQKRKCSKMPLEKDEQIAF